MKYLNQPTEWALKDEVRALIKDLSDAGIDPDLALGIIENCLPENQVYNLPKDDEDEPRMVSE